MKKIYLGKIVSYSPKRPLASPCRIGYIIIKIETSASSLKKMLDAVKPTRCRSRLSNRKVKLTLEV